MSTVKRKGPDKGINAAVQFFASAKSRLKFKGNAELMQALEQIEMTASSTGLSPDHITTLIDVVACGTQVQMVSKRILKALIPATVVPDTAVLKAISWLCTRTPSVNIQCLLVRWILVVYDYIDKMEAIHSLYGILFYFLHYKTLMPYVCHLLYLLTRKEDVRLFRVRLLIQYQKDLGPQPYLIGLLSIYKHYFPKLVQVVVPRTYKSFFPTYDRKWSSLIREVREQNGQSPQPDLSWHAALAERLNPTDTVGDLLPSYRKRRKLDPIPRIHSQATSSTYNSLQSKLGLERIPFVQIKTFKDLLKNMDSIEFPSQMGSVLRSDTLLHFLSFTKDPVAAARLQFWIAETFREELIDTFQGKTKDRVRHFLEAINYVCDFLQEGIPALDPVLSQLLSTWNGRDNSALIFKLISRCHMYSFTLLCGAVLEPLKKLYFMSSVFFKCKVIMCLTELLRNHVANEWPRLHEVSTSNSCECLFPKAAHEVDGVDSVIRLTKFVSKLILMADVDEQQHALLEFCALDFLELVSSLHKTFWLPFVVLVEPRLFERMLISPHLVTVSRVCMVVCRYKENFSSLKALQKAGELDSRHREETRMISMCNQIILDFCNTLWRFKAYTTADKQSVFHFNPEEVDKQLSDRNMSDSLSVFRHPAFLPFSMKFVKQMQMDSTVDFVGMKDRKKEFLQYLDLYNISGISQFIHLFIRSSSSSSTRASQGGTTQMMGISQTLSHTQMANNSAFGF